jgi:Cadherin cytoplasmic region
MLMSLSPRANQSFFFFSPPGTDDETHEYDYLGNWGPRFDKLANMYGPDREHTDLDGLN